MHEEIYMSEYEWDRYKILRGVQRKRITQVEAASMLNISDRQVRYLLKEIKVHGKQGVISKKRGKKSNNSKSQEIKALVLRIITEQYKDFGPTLACEKLREYHDITISDETLRQWMIQAHIWIPRKTKKRIHLPRERRACFGELIQADGSHHRWFGEDGPMVNLNVLIDDATGKLTSLVFSEGETLDSYFQALEQHLIKYGRPRAIYTDRLRAFYSSTEENATHFQYALKLLNIKSILAHSPQAKGRVERANRTLQDRLLKELKLKGITTIAEANAFASEYIEIYNMKFSKKPMKDFDAHRPLDGYDLERVLSRFQTRTLLVGSIFQFNNEFYKVQDLQDGNGKKIEIRLLKTGKMRVFFKDRELKIIPLNEVKAEQNEVRWKRGRGRPSGTKVMVHPWKHWPKAANM